MEEYNKLVERNQSGEINDLDFLMAQEDLALLYVQETLLQDIAPTNQNAREWLLKFEEQHLYQ